jgi:hypothetical protein
VRGRPGRSAARTGPPLERRSIQRIVHSSAHPWTGNCGEPSMARKASGLPLESWAAAVGAPTAEIETAWQDLQRRGLGAVKSGKCMVSPLAMRRANSVVQRRLAAHLGGFLLTENSFIVRRGDAARQSQHPEYAHHRRAHRPLFQGRLRRDRHPARPASAHPGRN